MQYACATPPSPRPLMIRAHTHTHIQFPGRFIAYACFTTKQCRREILRVCAQIFVNKWTGGRMDRWASRWVCVSSVPALGPHPMQVGHLFASRACPYLVGGYGHFLSPRTAFYRPQSTSRSSSLPEILGLSHLSRFCLGHLVSDKATGMARLGRGASFGSGVGDRT